MVRGWVFFLVGLPQPLGRWYSVLLGVGEIQTAGVSDGRWMGWETDGKTNGEDGGGMANVALVAVCLVLTSKALSVFCGRKKEKNALMRWEETRRRMGRRRRDGARGQDAM